MKHLRKIGGWLKERVLQLAGDTRPKEIRDAPFGMMEMTFSGNRHRQEAEVLRQASGKVDRIRFNPTAPSPEIFKDLVAAGVFHREADVTGSSNTCWVIARRDTRELFLYVLPIVSKQATAVISATSMRLDNRNSFMTEDDIRHTLNKLLTHLKKQNLDDKENVNG